jgi:hypothetical protein
MLFGTAVGLMSLLLVAALVLLRSDRATFSRYSSWLTVLIPTWRFFDRLEGSPDLFYRRCLDGSDPGPWLRVIPRPPRAFSTLFWNPEGNLALASYGVVDQLVAELEDRGPLELGEAEQLVSFRLVRCLVEYFCGAPERSDAAVRYQFRVVAVTPGELGPTYEELFTSDLFTATPAGQG